MEICDLVHHYPKLYHVSASGAWNSIKSLGLLSTSAILDKFGKTGSTRFNLECKRRPDSVSLVHPKYGTVTIRDQKPLSDIKVALGLKRGGSSISIEDWYKLLNGRVFFWTSEERLEKLLNGRAYQGLLYEVLVIDTRELVARYSNGIHLCHKNSGAMRAIHPIGPHVFKTIDQFSSTTKQNGFPKIPVVELTVEYAIPDIEDMVVEFQTWA